MSTETNARFGIPVCLMAELPWPPQKLRVNGSHGHWAPRARAKKNYRRAVGVLMRDHKLLAMISLLRRLKEPHIVVTFCPPDRQRRDLDNCIAAFKAGQDGIADVCGIDDSKFVVTHKFGPPCRGGAVFVSIPGAAT